jgi:hypothetical protein
MARMTIDNAPNYSNNNAFTCAGRSFTIECWPPWHSASNRGLAFNTRSFCVIFYGP